MTQNDHLENNNPASATKTTILSQRRTELALYTLLSASYAGIFQYFFRSEEKEFGFLLTTVSPSLAVLTTSAILWFLRRYALITQERDVFNVRFKIVEQEHRKAMKDLEAEIKRLRVELKKCDEATGDRIRTQIVFYESKRQELFVQLIEKRTELSAQPFINGSAR